MWPIASIPRLTKLPELAKPTAQMTLTYLKSVRRMTVSFPKSLWKAAGLRGTAVEVWIGPGEDCALVVAADTLPEAQAIPVEQRETRITEEFWRLGCSRLPETLKVAAANEGLLAIVGPGYVLVLPVVASKQYLGLPRVCTDVVETLKPELGQVDQQLPRFEAKGFKDFEVYQGATSRFCDIHGVIWHSAGIADGDKVHVTRFVDGLRIVKVSEGAPVPTGEVWTLTRSTRRIGLRMFRGLFTQTARVVYAKGILCVLAESVPVTDFGLSKRRRSGDKLPLTRAEGTERADAPHNTTIYPLKREEPRVQVQGAWLAKFGFVPGIKYVIEEHPLFPKRLLVRLDPEGEHTVTQHHGPESAKLYIPMRLMERFNTPEVRVWGASDGLHVQRYFGGQT